MPNGSISWLSNVEFGPSFGASNNGGSSTSSSISGAAAISALRSAPVDAVLLLAGGLLPDGGMPEWVCRRLDTAYDVHLLQQRSCPIVLLGV